MAAAALGPEKGAQREGGLAAVAEPDCAKEESVRPEGVRCQLTVQSVCVCVWAGGFLSPNTIPVLTRSCRPDRAKRVTGVQTGASLNCHAS